MDDPLAPPLGAEVRQFLEDMGLRCEEEGFPPMAGRIAGWLLICTPPHQTSGELAEVLGASPGSISTMTRSLVQYGLVEKVAVPGKRGTHFRIRPGAWSKIMRSKLENTRRMRALAERGLRLLEAAPPEARRRLEELRDLQAFIERELPSLLERWERRSEGRTP